MFQTGEINAKKFRGPGAIKTIHFGRNGEMTTLHESADGVVRDPDVSFDGRKVLFSLRSDPQDDYHLYEMAAVSGELKQLTFGSGISDIDPIYLPDGKILFSSTREPKYCMCNRHIMCNLFTMNGDGSDIQQGTPLVHGYQRNSVGKLKDSMSFQFCDGCWSGTPSLPVT
jgi:Tol biopolymer transport system component